ncbi:MAG: PRC-barrel domain-containing protein [Thermoplasmatales archaeon]|nr:PRC-barrel domain-containing protein [Thermoplasmatales archaeon]
MYFDYMMEKETNTNSEEVTSFLKLPVYTREGTYVGHVRNVFIDMDEKCISSLLVTNTNPSLVEGTVDVAVPYRWVNAVGDIVILSHFPERVTTKKKEEKTEEEEQSEIDVVE